MPTNAPMIEIPKQIHRAVCVPDARLPSDDVATCSSDRSDHERRNRPDQLDDREHALNVVERSEKPAMNSAGTTAAPTPMPISPEPTAPDGAPAARAVHHDDRGSTNMPVRA